MAYDEALAERVRAHLSGAKRVTEREMFGGISFMVAGNMCCGVLGDDLVVRLPPELHQDALTRPHTSDLLFGNRVAKGMVRVSGEGVDDETELGLWVRLGLTHAQSLPAKAAKKKAAPAKKKAPARKKAAPANKKAPAKKPATKKKSPATKKKAATKQRFLLPIYSECTCVTQRRAVGRPKLSTRTRMASVASKKLSLRFMAKAHTAGSSMKVESIAFNACQRPKHAAVSIHQPPQLPCCLRLRTPT